MYTCMRVHIQGYTYIYIQHMRMSSPSIFGFDVLNIACRHTHICIQTCIHTYKMCSHPCLFLLPHPFKCACLYIHIHMHIHIHIHVHALRKYMNTVALCLSTVCCFCFLPSSMREQANKRVYTFAYIHIYIHIYIYIYTHIYIAAYTCVNIIQTNPGIWTPSPAYTCTQMWGILCT